MPAGWLTLRSAAPPPSAGRGLVDAPRRRA